MIGKERKEKKEEEGEWERNIGEGRGGRERKEGRREGRTEEEKSIV